MRLASPSIRTILLLTIGALTLLIMLLVAYGMVAQWRRLAEIQALKQAMIVSDQLFDATEKLSEERDIAYSLLYVRDKDGTASLSLRLDAVRRQADKALLTALNAVGQYRFPDQAEELHKTQTQFFALQELRRAVDQAVMLPPEKRDHALSDRWFAQTTSLILQTQNVWMGFAGHFSDIDSSVTLHMRFKHLLGVIVDYSGRERSVIGRLIAENADPQAPEQAQLIGWQGAVDLGWKISETLAIQGGLEPKITPYLKDAESHYFMLYNMTRDMFYLPLAQHGAAYPIGVDFWLELATQTTDSLYALKDAALQETGAYMATLEAKAQHQILLDALFLAFALVLSLYSFRVVNYRVIHPINAIVSALISATEGKSVSVPPPSNPHDEIGKLTRVLQVLQKNTEELLHYTSALERSNKELDDFAYIASHDLKEPLRGIHNHARFLLEDNQDKLDSDSVSRLNRLTYLSQRMERLVNDLLYFSRLGRQDMAIGETDMNAVVLDIENTLDVFLAEHHARIVVPATLPVITCDKTRVTELLRNLITNGVKYSDKLEKQVEIGFLDSYAHTDGTRLCNVFYVKDDGRGIAPEFHEEVFRIFKRLQSSKDQQTEGTGVGLTFVKKIVERHAGRIWLASEVGKGTTFYFTLGESHDNKQTDK